MTRPPHHPAPRPPLATLPLCGSLVDLRVFEGTLQIILRDPGAPIAAQGWINRFCDAATPGELRALADRIEAALPQVAE